MDLLAKSIFDVLKYPIAGMLGASMVIGVTTFCFAVFKWFAPFVMVSVFVLGFVIFMIIHTYKSLVNKRLRDEQDIIDRLKR